jgi:hypothetical protein
VGSGLADDQVELGDAAELSGVKNELKPFAGGAEMPWLLAELDFVPGAHELAEQVRTFKLLSALPVPQDCARECQFDSSNLKTSARDGSCILDGVPWVEEARV